MKITPIRPGDIVTDCDGEQFRVLEIGPRNAFERVKVELLGDGIIGLNLRTGEEEYFLDIDVDEVNGKPAIGGEGV